MESFINIVKPKVILEDVNWGEKEKKIEKAGRLCYKSEDKINKTSRYKFINHILERGHEAVIEHSTFSAIFVIDRGVSHELVRHRLASYAQESTRYCNYSKDKFNKKINIIDIMEILEMEYGDGEEVQNIWNTWKYTMEGSAKHYFKMLEMGATPEIARDVLPNSLKTEIIVTANIREWRHILKLRTARDAHPQIRQVMIPLLIKLTEESPLLFGDMDFPPDWSKFINNKVNVEIGL